MNVKLPVIVLDAMGVIYSVGDDVQDLLCPFIAEKGGCRDIHRVSEIYVSASLGELSNIEFWVAVDVDPGFEDEYLERHTLMEGVLDFLRETSNRGYEIWCLSNDLSEWSKKLRNRFELGRYISGFFISGDVGFRKPDPLIFYKFMRQSRTAPRYSIFIDDSPKNLDAAATLGFKTILFKPTSNLDIKSHRTVMSFDEINLLLT